MRKTESSLIRQQQLAKGERGVTAGQRRLLKAVKLEPLPARSDEMMAYLATMTPIEVWGKDGRKVTVMLSKLAVGRGERK